MLICNAISRSRLLMALICCVFFCLTSAARTFFVSSTRGNDLNDGSLHSPFKTISKGALLACPGDTVLVMEGVYRERVAPARGGLPGKPIVYLAQPGIRVIVKGSDLWKPKWQEERKGIYFARPDDTLFTDDVYFDNANPFKVLVASTPWGRDGVAEGIPAVRYTLGQLFVWGRMWKQVPIKEEMLVQNNTWWYNDATCAIYVNAGDLSGMEAADIEITTRRRIFAPHQRGLGYIQVKGFVFEHCGNQFPRNFWEKKENAQAGAVGLRQGNHWVVSNNVIRYANSIGIDCGAEGAYHERTDVSSVSAEAIAENVIENNYLIDNGSNGLASYGSSNLVIRNNVVMYNNNLRFRGYKRYEQAGIKLHNAQKALVINNYVASNFTYGIWLDNQFPDARICRNVIAGNGESGVFLEMSDYPFDKVVIDNNVIIGNRENAIYIHDASGSTIINNLLANTPGDPEHPEFGQSVFIRQVSKRTRTYHHSFYNNIQLHSSDVYSINYPSDLSGEQRLDGNVYDAKPADRKFVINYFSTMPSPFNGDSLQRQVLADIKSTPLKKEQIGRGSNVQLTFDEWKVFWKVHGNLNDENSILSDSSIAAFNTETSELKLVVGFEPTDCKTIYLPQVNKDFFGNKIMPEFNAPGPFQQIQKGMNLFKVWDGLPIPKQGVLPRAGINLDH